MRESRGLLNLACVLIVVEVWIETGMGLIVPGFVPTPIGEIFEYTPTFVEIAISIGIWAFGILLFTLFAKIAIPIELGQLRYASAGRRSPPHEEALRPASGSSAA